MRNGKSQPESTGKKMKIVLIKNHKDKILEKRISRSQKYFGMVSVQKLENGSLFTVHCLGAHHIRYHYDPKTQTFLLHFVSSKKREKKGRGNR